MNIPPRNPGQNSIPSFVTPPPPIPIPNNPGSVPPRQPSPPSGHRSAPPSQKRSLPKIDPKQKTNLIWGIGAIAVGAGLFFGFLPWRVAAMIAVSVGIFQGLKLWRNNPMDAGFKVRQLLVRVLLVFIALSMAYIAGINAQPYQEIVQVWNPPSFWDRFNVLEWLFRRSFGYIIWAVFQICETLVFLLCGNKQSAQVLVKDSAEKARAKAEPQDLIASVQRFMGAPIIAGLWLLMIVAFAGDAAILISYYPPFEMGVLNMGALATLALILIGFQVLVWVWKLVKELDERMFEEVILERMKFRGQQK